MMRASLRALAIMLPLIGLLTWLLLDSVGPQGAGYVFAQRDVARVSLGEAALRRDVLQARAGLLRNYDPLVADIDILRQSAAELRQQAMVRSADGRLLDQLIGKVDQDEVALERFKSDNALLQNSLAYFDVLDMQIAGADVDPGLSAAVRTLGNSVLHLTRDSSPSVQRVVRQRLDAIAAMASRSGNRDGGVDLLVAHGRMLSHLLPGVDEDLRTLFSVSTYDLRQAVRASQDARRIAEEGRAERFRLALYGAALLLSAVLVRVGLHWRAGLRLLRERAELEYVIAGISTRFIACPLDQYEPMLEETLSRLGPAFGADRAYLLLVDTADPVRLWSRPGAGFPDGWPGSVLTAALALAQGADELLDVPRVADLTAGRLRDELLAAGIGSWCGIVLRYDAGRTGLLAFDRLRVAAPWPRAGAGTVRMAGEVLSHALQRRHAAAERLELEARLGRASRLEAVGTFASGIAHNFNNMIGAVLGYAEMAADSTPPDAPSAGHIQEVRRAGERARELVGRILDFGTRSSAQHRIVSVGALLQDMLPTLRVLLPENVELVMAPPPSDLFVSGDAVQLHQAILNLLHNAAQAMEKGGRITVQVDALQVGAALDLSHDALPPGDYVRLRVIDTGTGMDAVTLDRIFQPFFTTRPAGTGLGLATVREIVQDHDGAIDVRSTFGRGSRFTVWLPSTRPAPSETASCHGTGQTIMLLGPDPLVILHDEDVLAALGYEPVGFSDVDAAIAAGRIAPGRFDALMVDVSRLDGDGCRAVGRLREIMPDRPVLLVSRGPVEINAADLAARGISGILQRPLRSNAVAAALSQSCNMPA